ncbi:2579_t:CDS:2, partial [Gigaspora rosea]
EFSSINQFVRTRVVSLEIGIRRKSERLEGLQKKKLLQTGLA